MARQHILVLFPKDWDRDELDGPLYADRYVFHYEGFDLFRFPENARLLTFDVRRYVDRLVRRYRGRIDGVISNNEHVGVLVASAVAQRLGLPGLDPAVVIACQHKYYARVLQQRIVPEATPAFDVLPYDVRDMPLPATGFPCFVKPVKATYSVLARRIDHAGQLRELMRFSPLERLILRKLVQPLDDLARVYTPFTLSARAMIAEEILQGEQINVDGFVDRGRVTLLGMVDEVMYPGTQAFMRFEYPSRLTAVQRLQVTALTEKLLGGLHYNHGFFNLELMRDARTGDLRVIEVNPRMASQITNLYRRVDGCDPYAMLLALATGESPVVRQGEGQFGAAASFVFRRFDGRSPARIPGRAQIDAIHRRFPDARLMLYLKRGRSLAREMKWLGSHRYAVLNLGGSSTADLHARYEVICRELAFDGADAAGAEAAVS